MDILENIENKQNHKYKNSFKNIRNMSCLTSMNNLFSRTDGKQQVTYSLVVANNTEKNPNNKFSTFYEKQKSISY